ncbi:MAG: GntR family transcriptional regulator [Clostridiales bacterium]|jgi:K+/H+ antiporter YhaU regulatory subunit KhtT|nr:GntR family transcriptional regulator [Clostridiales bacterium]
MEEERFPQYKRIAIDIASQIADGEIGEGERVSGRSLLASEYGVSPETIRRSLRLLADMKVVEIEDKKGVTILSADNAKRYISDFKDRNEQHDLHLRLKELFDKYVDISRQTLDVFSDILNAQQHPLRADKELPNYEVRVSEKSPLIGKNLGALHFWQQTGATIVAIRRKQSTIISPGPYAELYGGDIIVFVSQPEAAATVESFVNGDSDKR